MDDEALAVKIDRAARLLDCGRSTVLRLINDGRLDVITFQRSRRITMASLKKLLAEGLGDEDASDGRRS